MTHATVVTSARVATTSLDLLGTRVEVHAEVESGADARAGVDAAGAADAAALLDGIRAVYASVPGAHPPHGSPSSPSATLRVRVRDDRAAGEAALDLPRGRVVGRAAGARARGAAVAFALFHEVAARAVEHFVVHAGVIEAGAAGAGAVLLVAPSRAGKTTLTLALALRGARFLSDEAAPVARASGLVEPFPRAVGLRPGPLDDDTRLERARKTALVVAERGGRTKEVVDLIATGVVRPGAAAPPRHVVFLAAGTPSRAPLVHWLLEIDRRSPVLADRLGRAAGVVRVVETGSEAEPALLVVAEPGARLARAVDEACAAAGCLAVQLAEEPERPPDYDLEPSIRELGSAEGLLALARHLQNGPQSRLLEDECGGSATRLVVELAAPFRATRFWSLASGRLDAMCALVEGLR